MVGSRCLFKQSEGVRSRQSHMFPMFADSRFKEAEDKERLSQSSTLEQIRFTIIPVAFLITDKLPKRSSVQEGLILAHSLGGCCPSQQGRHGRVHCYRSITLARFTSEKHRKQTAGYAGALFILSSAQAHGMDGMVPAVFWQCTALVPAWGRQR